MRHFTSYYVCICAEKHRFARNQLINQSTKQPVKLKPVQPVAPLLSHPAAQLPHVLLPAVFVQVRLAWHPPLFEAHSLISNQANAHTHRYLHVYDIYTYPLKQLNPQNLPEQQTYLHSDKHSTTPTVAARRPRIRPTRWTVATFSAALQVLACTFAVAPAVV